jgi:sRNA-binding carbon storage regulator CsrA
LAFAAPRDVAVDREEVWERKNVQEQPAASAELSAKST